MGSASSKEQKPDTARLFFLRSKSFFLKERLLNFLQNTLARLPPPIAHQNMYEDVESTLAQTPPNTVLTFPEWPLPYS